MKQSSIHGMQLNAFKLVTMIATRCTYAANGDYNCPSADKHENNVEDAIEEAFRSPPPPKQSILRVHLLPRPWNVSCMTDIDVAKQKEIGTIEMTNVPDLMFRQHMKGSVCKDKASGKHIMIFRTLLPNSIVLSRDDITISDWSATRISISRGTCFTVSIVLVSKKTARITNPNGKYVGFSLAFACSRGLAFNASELIKMLPLDTPAMSLMSISFHNAREEQNGSKTGAFILIDSVGRLSSLIVNALMPFVPRPWELLSTRYALLLDLDAMTARQHSHNHIFWENTGETSEVFAIEAYGSPGLLVDFTTGRRYMRTNPYNYFHIVPSFDKGDLRIPWGFTVFAVIKPDRFQTASVLNLGKISCGIHEQGALTMSVMAHAQTLAEYTPGKWQVLVYSMSYQVAPDIDDKRYVLTTARMYKGRCAGGSGNTALRAIRYVHPLEPRTGVVGEFSGEVAHVQMYTPALGLDDIKQVVSLLEQRWEIPSVACA